MIDYVHSLVSVLLLEAMFYSWVLVAVHIQYASSAFCNFHINYVETSSCLMTSHTQLFQLNWAVMFINNNNNNISIINNVEFCY